jgi:hypothetical protein
MHDEYVAEFGVVGERRVHGSRVVGYVLGCLQNAVPTFVIVADPRNALSVGTIDEYKSLGVAGQKRPHGCLDDESSAALQGYAYVSTLTTRECNQAIPHWRSRTR